MKNNNWIEINLPWSSDLQLPSPYYPYEEVQEKVREKFGTVSDELIDEFKKKFNIQFTWDFNTATASENDFIEYKNLFKKCREIREWTDNNCDNDPLLVEFDKKIKEWALKNSEYIKTKSFSASELCHAGVLIKVDNEGEIVTYLIGNINEVGGSFDDCIPFKKDAIVLCAKEILKMEDFDEK
jgi:hypothetical protein